jgi:hypothetical protein
MIRFKAGKNEFAGFKRKQFNNSEKLVIETRKIVTDPCHQRSAFGRLGNRKQPFHTVYHVSGFGLALAML